MTRTRAHRWTEPTTLDEIARQVRTGRLTRRRALRLLGGASLAAGGMAVLGPRALAQDGTPLPAATPQIGPRDDGSTVWRVKVADMRMDKQPMVELHTFFPDEITVAEGDAIWFDFGQGGFHTVSFFSGADVIELIVPDPEAGTPEAQAVGTPAPAGTPALILNPDVAFPAGGDTYDGTGYVSSGIDVFRDPAQPYVLTFSKAGTYDYLCIVHAEVMKGTVTVRPAGTAAPMSQADYDRASADRMATLYAQGDAEIAGHSDATPAANADGPTTWEATVGGGGDTPVRIQAFFPPHLEVAVGDTVTWTHRAGSEPHTVSFIGQGEAPPEDPVGQFADGSPKFYQNPLILMPSGGNVWSGTGFVNSGFLGSFIPGGPTQFSVTFDTAGDFGYYCLLHGDAQGEGMAAKITVAEA